mmetsp:Transcript_17557/g.19044  ORF Transcript_17557/g.19044 Transcript_17557/m.19044 type:complete len:104 (-) Transcript_17557:1048-1359(-)
MKVKYNSIPITLTITISNTINEFTILLESQPLFLLSYSLSCISHHSHAFYCSTTPTTQQPPLHSHTLTLPPTSLTYYDDAVLTALTRTRRELFVSYRSHQKDR